MRKELDPYTFGDSPAAITLAKILSQPEHEKCCSRISTKYHEFCELMWGIFSVKNVHQRAALFHLVMKDAREKVDSMKAPDDVKSYLLNIMNKVYKRNIKHCRDISLAERAKAQRKRDLERSRKDG